MIFWTPILEYLKIRPLPNSKLPLMALALTKFWRENSIQFDTIMLLVCSLTLTMLNPNIPGVVNSVDSDQLASRPSDQDPHRFPFCS